VLVVEDATAGVTAGRAAGATVLAVTTTTPGIVADLVVPDLAAVRFVPGPDGITVLAADGAAGAGRHG
jgi:sugar-phosphatase